MVQSPSWEANCFAASQEIPHISWNPKVHYHTHKRPPAVSILGQPNPVHIPTSHLLEIHPNIIHPSMPRSPQWSLSLWFPHQDPIHPLSSPICTIIYLIHIIFQVMVLFLCLGNYCLLKGQNVTAFTFRWICKIVKCECQLLHICPSAWNNSTPTGRIFTKFDVPLFLKKNLSR